MERKWTHFVLLKAALPYHFEHILTNRTSFFVILLISWNPEPQVFVHVSRKTNPFTIR